MQKNPADKTKRVLRHFQRVDPVIFLACKTTEWEPLYPKAGPRAYFAQLCREIIAQQLGSGAARAIEGRFRELFPRRQITPERVLAHSEKQLRAIGMSWAKARYLRSIAEHTAAGALHFNKFPSMDDEAIIGELTQIKGIGRWTAEMFLIFALGREDIFSFGDLGLRRAFARLYGAQKARSQKSVEKITRRWSPYRSYASLALWNVVDV
ncbi:MAG: DNA-3-methyladenine glycosylase 2 family protein [Patescibacteria group bacterium]